MGCIGLGIVAAGFALASAILRSNDKGGSAWGLYAIAAAFMSASCIVMKQGEG
jgi:hypothetical protein